MARLFVAVWPPDDLTEQLRGLPRKERPGLRWVPPENWHTTLRFYGDADAEEIAGRLDTLLLPPARARYGPAVDVRWQRTIVLPVAGLGDLAAAVASATAGIGTEPASRRFAGHLTIGRLKKGARVPPTLIGTPVAAAHAIHEIALVASALRPTGAEYETLETWRPGERGPG